MNTPYVCGPVFKIERDMANETRPPKQPFRDPFKKVAKGG
jgi:hypothetical protein